MAKNLEEKLKEEGIKEKDEIQSQPYMVPFDGMERDVYGPGGAHLGKIEDLILDLNNKRIAFGILSFGGLLGVGEKYYAIPWKILDYKKDAENKERFILDIDKEKLEKAKSFERGKYSYAQQGPWADELYDYWKYPPYWKKI